MVDFFCRKKAGCAGSYFFNGLGDVSHGIDMGVSASSRSVMLAGFFEKTCRFDAF